ncbi:MAG: phosphate/phosphite/phosphonate ABC transporter substrate-binding protein [Desulfuromonadaceae bacterium]|nr:phosphate/phosphite/phosphonate ABC transporter substrate-binding protein [Desulfuromonadaceae bacterium]
MKLAVTVLSALLFTLAIPLFAADKPVIRFGVIPRYNPVVMYKRYQPIMDYLTQNTPYRFELKISRDYPEAVRFLKDGITQISSLGDVTFTEASTLYGAIPILKPLNHDGIPFYRSAIIVSKNSPLKSLHEIKGKNMVFGSPHSTSGNLIPRYMLWNNGIRLQELASITNLKHHDAVAKAILKGQYDAGAVKDVIANKYMSHGLRVLAYSDFLPSVPFVVRKEAPPEFIKAVKQALLKLDRNNSEHKKIMANWDDEFKFGFAEANSDDYRMIFSMMRDIPSGCGYKCHR